MDEAPDAIAGAATVMNRVRQVVDESGDRGSFASAARRIGISRAELVRLWTEPDAVPDTRTLERIADAYGASLAWLVSGIE